MKGSEISGAVERLPRLASRTPPIVRRFAHARSSRRERIQGNDPL